MEARKIAAIADAHYVPIAPHNPNGEVSYASAVQMAACVPNFLVLESFPPEKWAEDVCANPKVIKDGWLEIPDRPGLGVELNEEEALKHPYESYDLYNLHRPVGEIPVPKYEDSLR